MSKYSIHQEFLKEVKIALQIEFPDMRIFDQHVGMFNTMQGRPIMIGKKGMADMFGLLKTPYGLMYIQIEIKTGSAVQNKDQKIWQKFIESMNGVYIVVTDNKPIKAQIEVIYEWTIRIIESAHRARISSNTSKGNIQ